MRGVYSPEYTRGCQYSEQHSGRFVHYRAPRLARIGLFRPFSDFLLRVCAFFWGAIGFPVAFFCPLLSFFCQFLSDFSGRPRAGAGAGRPRGDQAGRADCRIATSGVGVSGLGKWGKWAGWGKCGSRNGSSAEAGMRDAECRQRQKEKKKRVEGLCRRGRRCGLTAGRDWLHSPPTWPRDARRCGLTASRDWLHYNARSRRQSTSCGLTASRDWLHFKSNRRHLELCCGLTASRDWLHSRPPR